MFVYAELGLMLTGFLSQIFLIIILKKQIDCLKKVVLIEDNRGLIRAQSKVLDSQRFSYLPDEDHFE